MKRTKGNKIKMSKEEMIYQICIAAIVGLVVLSCVLPFVYVIGMSLTSQGEIMERNYFVIIPRKPILKAYEQLIQNQNFFSGMRITVTRTVIGVFTALILTIPVGYILAIRNLPFKNAIMVFFIITMILGGGLIPQYLLYRDLGLLNSFWVYIAPSFSNTYGILITKLFVVGIPKELMESAELDGATEMQKMTHIAIPLLKPTICSLGLFAAVAHWNSWMDAMIYIKDNAKWPLQFVIRNMLNSTTTADITTSGTAFMKMSPESLKMASVIVAVLPILCVYPFLQKYFISGVFTGAVKE